LTVDLGSSPTANQLQLSASDAKNANRYGLEIGMCSVCKHIQLLEIVNPEILFSDYIYKSGTSATFVKHFSELAGEISNLKLDINYVLEVGSNDGTLLSRILERGVRAVGIEPSQILAEECNKAGLETKCGYFNNETMKQLVEINGNPTIIVGNNVFAHIDDLNEAFDCARKNLDPNGYFIFEVADVSRIIRDGIFDTIYHEHMSYHSVTSMVSMAKAHGLKIARIDLIPTHGGSFRFFLTIDGPIDPNLDIDSFLDDERELGLDSEKALNKISDQITKMKTQVDSCLQQYIDSSEYLLIGYGAPAKVVTFLSTLSLEDTPILGIIDDNEYKQNKFLPGSGIRILSAPTLLEEIGSIHPNKKVACLVFPWNLGEELKGKIASQLPPGSKIITFFPELHEVEF
jgi:SAM-dependent methyltransferase